MKPTTNKDGGKTAVSVKKTVGKKAVGAKKTAAVARRTIGPRDSPTWQPDLRAGLVVEALGNKRTAEMLGVSESQPSRWRRSEEVPSPRIAPVLVDLDHIIARLQLIWDRQVIGDWLEGSNAFLDGARPIDVLQANGSVQVLEAIEAEASGAYA
jgi:hypothetical protein